MNIAILDDYQDTIRTLACFDQMIAYADGKPINVVNPEVLAGRVRAAS